MPEIFQSMSSRKISVSLGCCKAILELDEECASNAFETVPFFYPLLKQHCSTHLTQKLIPHSSPSSSSSSTSTPPSSKNAPLKQDPSSNPSTSSPVQSASPPNTPSSGNQPSLPFELKPVQLPLVYGGGEGCWQGSEIIIVVGEAKETMFPMFGAIWYDLEVRIVRLEESRTMLTKGVVCSLMMDPRISVLRLLPIILNEGNVHGVVSMRLARSLSLGIRCF